MPVLTQFLALVVLSAMPCPEYPQFPNNARVREILKEVRTDKIHIAEFLKHFGAWYECDELRWRDVPRFLEPVRAAWIENERIIELYESLQALTIGYSSNQSLTPLQMIELESWLRKELTDDWFERGLMPVPLSWRGACPKLQ